MGAPQSAPPTKRALPEEEPPETTPQASQEVAEQPADEPNPKRQRTAQPSGVPGIANVPVDEAQRNSFFDITTKLLRVGGVPLESTIKEVDDRERQEARDVMMANSGIVLIPADDGDDEEEGDKTDPTSFAHMLANGNGGGAVGSSTDSTAGGDSQSKEEGKIDMDVDGAVARSRASSSEPADERVTKCVLRFGSRVARVGNGADCFFLPSSPTKYLAAYWRENVTKWHSPKYDLGQAATGAALFGCDLHLHFPPNSTRTFTAPAVYPLKREAKDAVSRLAIKHGVLEQGKAAREAAGDEPQELIALAEDGFETLDNPMGVLHQAYQKFMPIGMFTFEYATEPISTCPSFSAARSEGH